MAFNRFRRRCGSSSVAESLAGMSSTSAGICCSRGPDSASFTMSSASSSSFKASGFLDGCSAMERKAAITPFFTHPRSMELFAEK